MTLLKALVDYYDQTASKELPFAHTVESISYALVLTPEGQLCNIRPLVSQQMRGRKEVDVAQQPLAVPRFYQPTSATIADFLWGKVSYVLGVGQDGKDKLDQRHAEFRSFHFKHLSGENDEGLNALVRFLQGWTRDDASHWGLSVPVEELITDAKGNKADKNVVFMLRGDRQWRYLHRRDAALRVWRAIVDAYETTPGVCLITGERTGVLRRHPVVRGLKGQGMGAPLVSAKKEKTAFHSYGKAEALNAPIGKDAAFKYTAGLSHLLRSDSNHIQVDDLSIVFWAEDPTGDPEKLVRAALADGGTDQAEPTAPEGAQTASQKSAKIRKILTDLANGVPVEDAEGWLAGKLLPGTRFHIVGLTPHEGRIAVRFWRSDTLGAIARSLAEHHADMEIDPPPKSGPPSVWRLAAETIPRAATKKKIPNRLATEMIRAIVEGQAYPRLFLAALVTRIRSDRDERDERSGKIRNPAITPVRVAALKACLAREARLAGRDPNTEVPMSLDPSNKNPGYRLGRLFAVYEYAQVNAHDGRLNTTIRDQYYGAASATPRTVFAVLDRKFVHNLATLRKEPG
jgi:CRISPR-associated protein Csd1